MVGHDVSANVAGTAALTLPDTFTGAAMLGVPFTSPGGPRPSGVFAGLGGDEEFYVSYFQRPGVADAEIEPDVRTWMTGFCTSLGGEADPPAVASGLFFIPQGARMSDRFSAAPPPAWLTTEVLDETTGAFAAPA